MLEEPDEKKAPPSKRRTQPPEPEEGAGEDERDEQVSELENALREEKARSEDYLRRLQYLQADFENYRKRVEKEMSETRRMGNERLLSDLLLVNDELDLALQKAKEENETPVMVEGVGMVHKRLEGLLAKEGVQRIESVGAKFNPDVHDAALSVPSDQEEGTIVEEIRPGFLLKGKVLRHSIVKVAGKQGDLEPEAEEKT